MAKYKLLVTAESWMQVQWIENPDGSSLTGRDISFVVESSRSDECNPDDLLKQNGLRWKKNISRPSVIKNQNGWSVKVIG